MEISGKVKFIGKDNQVSASFVKRELVVTTAEQYPQHILINFVQDKCDLLDVLKVGQEVTVSINLRGREWVNPQGETKYFNDIQGWKVKGEKEESQAPVIAPVQEMPAAPNAFDQEDESDDLPF